MSFSAPLASRVATLKPSATIELTERVRAARGEGRAIIGLSSGDPNLDTDPRIIEAAEIAMKSGDTHYGPSAGMLELREAICERESRHAGVEWDPANVLVTPGGKFALLTALMATVEPGDEVIVPAPGWVSYEPCVRLCGGTPISLNMLDRVDSEALAAVITPRTRAIILNSPVNPTGRVLSAEDLKAVADLAVRHGLWVVFDQVYSDLLYDGNFPYLQAIENVRPQTIIVDSTSKTFGMTGWRLGYLALPPRVAKTILKFMQHSIYCVPGFVQTAGLRALQLHDEIVPAYREMFRRRLDMAARALDSIDGIRCSAPAATFYLFPSIEADDVETAKRWLDEIDVAVLPGSSFGVAGRRHLRLSVTCSDADLKEALDRIKRVGLPK